MNERSGASYAGILHVSVKGQVDDAESPEVRFDPDQTVNELAGAEGTARSIGYRRGWEVESPIGSGG